MSPDNPFAQGAPIWRAQGWMCTLLLPHGKKSPPPVDYTGRLGELEVSDEQFEAWCMQGGNLGIRLPRGVIGIDVDWYKPEGEASWARLVAECGPLPATYKSSARPTLAHSGIYLYRIDSSLELRDKPLDGIEIIQFHHRYICTWPSIHPDGEKYRLTDPKGMMGVRPPLVDELPWLPESWLKRLVHVERPVGVTKPREHTGQWSRAVSAAYSECDVALMGAGRHDAMRHGIDALTRLSHDGHPGASEAVALLSTKFVNAVVGDGTRSPAEAHSELQRMLEGASDLIESTPSYRPSWEDLRGQGKAVSGLLPATVATPLDPDDDPFPFEDKRSHLEAGLAPEVGDILYRADGTALLYSGKVNTIFGTSGSGKTWVALVAIAQAISQGLRCLYIDWEDDVRTFLRRLLYLGADESDILEYAEYTSPTGPASYVAVQRLIDLRFHLVVMDSTGEGIAAQGGLNQNDDGDVATWMRGLPRPLAWSGAGVLLVDHMPKALDGPRQEIGSQRKRAAVSGASYEVDQVEAFSKYQAGKLILRTGKDRGGNWARGSIVGEMTLIPGEERLHVRLEVPMWTNDGGEVVRPTSIMERVSLYLESHPGATVRAIEVDVHGRKATIAQAVAVLVDEGYVSTNQVGRRIEHRSDRPYREATDPALRPPETLE